MTKIFIKIKPLISLDDFLYKAKSVTSFTSSTGRRYKVTGFVGDEMFLRRLDANESINWKLNLVKVYQAYEELNDFSVINFKLYVPIIQSPARGLLLYLELIK